MNVAIMPSLGLRCRSRMRQRLVLLLVALAIAGCATRAEVEEIVAQSNTAMLGPAPHAMEGANNWKEAVGRIEQFIADHPDNKVLVSTLRVRQAMLLAANGQTSIAAEVFDLVKPQHLRGRRDPALYALRVHLVWWYGAGGMVADADEDRAQSALEAFKTEVVKIDDGQDARYFLGEMRAWIALAEAKRSADAAHLKKYLKDGMDTHLDLFPEDDLTWIESNPNAQDEDIPLGLLRRRLRALTVIEEYRKATPSGIDPGYKHEWVHAR